MIWIPLYWYSMLLRSYVWCFDHRDFRCLSFDNTDKFPRKVLLQLSFPAKIGSSKVCRAPNFYCRVQMPTAAAKGCKKANLLGSSRFVLSQHPFAPVMLVIFRSSKDQRKVVFLQALKIEERKSRIFFDSFMQKSKGPKFHKKSLYKV